ncbi:MAG: TPM domain-containing protein [Clostridia bacterium]|nr:TPM domain-containing protein [Clostridia bacterium]
MKKILAAVIAVLITAALAVSVFADYPAKPDSYVYDGAEMLSEEAEAEIESVSKALFVSKGIQIAVCTVDNTGDIPANTYARGVFGEWGVNGVLILAVKSTDFYYAVQSSSISDTLTDEKLGEIMNTVLEPEFAAGNYSAGFSATVKTLKSFIEENVKTAETADSTEKPSTETPKKKNGFVIFLIIVLILAVILGGGYGLLVYLEKKQERERRLRLEERRRRLAQSGRGNYYGAPATNGRPGNAYGQSPAGRGDFEREYGAPRQGSRGGDRFVYPESSPTARPGQRMQNPANNVNRRTVSAPPRGQRVDFDREYYKGTPAGEENVDASATREFTRN